MKIFEDYLKKQNATVKGKIYPYAPLTVVIPCYDEPKIIETLDSLLNNTSYTDNLHIIIVVNQNTKSPRTAVNQNLTTFTELELWRQECSSSQCFTNLFNCTFPNDNMGVGDARKIGMDEAVRQYAHHGKDGIIISLDADTTCEYNYLKTIQEHYKNYPKTNATVSHFEHPLEALSENQQQAMVQYELYLRYMSLAYQYVGHPNAFFTIGSTFSVKVSAYCKQGGMNRRQAGEDFYFLQKIFSLGNCHELAESSVYPSARLSDRVPFGTGKAVSEIMQSQNNAYETYNFRAFEELKVFFEMHEKYYKISKKEYENIVYNNLGGLIKSWLIAEDFFADIAEINSNCASLNMFSKKFFERFSILQIIRYLNFSHTHFVQKTNIFHALSCLSQAKEFDFSCPLLLLKSVRKWMRKNPHTKI